METISLFQPIITEGKPTTVLPDNVAQIAVIGVGGGGCNIVNHMISEGVNMIDLIVSNTDLKALESSNAPVKIQLGAKLTKGLGTGIKPEIGKESALESYEEIKEALAGSDIVFITAGLGGGTGTGASVIVAKAAKEINVLTVSVVTMPYAWEGKTRTALANLGLEELKKYSDLIIVMKNDRLKKINNCDIEMKDSFRMVDNVIYTIVKRMSEVILKPESGDMNLDFADVKPIIQHCGVTLIGIGKGKGGNVVRDAIENAIKSPLLDEVSLESVKGIMIHWTLNTNLSLFAVTEIMENINDIIDTNADIIYCTTTDDKLADDEVEVTIIATGFQEKEPTAEHNEDTDEKTLEQEKLDCINTFAPEKILSYKSFGCWRPPYLVAVDIFFDKKIILEFDSKEITKYLDNNQFERISNLLSVEALLDEKSYSDADVMDGGGSEIVFRCNNKVNCVINRNSPSSFTFSEDYERLIDYLRELLNDNDPGPDYGPDYDTPPFMRGYTIKYH